MVTALAPQAEPDAPSKDRLRLWIRLLRAAHTIEAELREKLKSEFGSTLPRFDVMSALHRQPDGMLMTDLSRYLLVSNGNVTGIIDRLVSDGFVQRTKRDGDRRTSVVRLTESGVSSFRKMAEAHEGWVDGLLNGVNPSEARTLAAMLKNFRSEWEDSH